MTLRILFLLSPMVFGGWFLLMGETFNWLKKRKMENKGMRMTVLSHLRRK